MYMSDMSKLDKHQMDKITFDEATKSRRMYLAGGDLSIELNAEDGDSVLVKQDTQILEVSNGDVVDLSRFSKLCLIGAESCQIKAFVDNQEFLLYTVAQGEVKQICLTSVKIGLNVEKAYLTVQ
jgi:hypothetical protein